MSEWERVRLNEVIALDVDAVPVTATATYDIVGVLNRGRGLLFREPIAGDETSYKTLNRIRPNQIVYSRLKAFEGAITVAPNDLSEVYASQEFPAFTCGERMLPEYFRLLTTTKRLWEQLQSLSTGMGGRRERVKPAAFLTIEVALPSLPEQRRIVDVMATVDAQMAALTKEIEAATRTLSVLRADVPESGEVPIASVVDGIDSGRSVQTRGEAPVQGKARVLKLSAVQLGHFDANEAKRLDDHSGYAQAHLVNDGDLLITRSNTPERVGYVAVAFDVPADTYLPDLIWRIRPDESRCLATYLGHLLSATEFRARITASASGTSKSMQKINKKNFGALKVPVPAIADQKAYVAKCDAMADALRVGSVELSHLRAFRSALLASLLNQENEIPESYDVLLEEAS
ncbi:restriction endonuclease subunit S [Streptomyces rubiginosohelvolus]|uniref:restriction endonuclease subunit S n=1 Tax=Streptomyces rubiginosohelvolus TaxID=67362 RepID=UPI0036D82E3B